MNEKFERICWSVGKQEESLRRCVIGRVIKEDDKELVVSSTKSNQGFIDKIKIAKKDIFSRKLMVVTKDKVN
jgi:hypothetical protein